jgi:hypothetical protein
MQGFDLGQMLRAFAGVLGEQSYPMCRAITKAFTGHSLEPNTMDFEELLVAYRKPEGLGEEATE